MTSTKTTPSDASMVAANVAPPTVDVGARGRVAWLWFLVTAACCLPVVTVETVPLYDYYNHVARLHILANLDTSPHLSRFFEADWRVLPNLGFELIGLPLVWLLGSAEMAGRATLLIAIAAFLGGAVALNRAVNGRWSALPLVLAVVVYNYILLMGFMSFLLSLGGFLFAAALWISVAKRPALERLAVGAVAATLLFFFHMVGFAFYCVTIGCVELARCVREQRLPPPGRALIFLGHLVPATVLFVGFSPTAGATIGGTTWSDLWNPWAYYGKLWGVTDLVQGYVPAVDHGALVVVGAVLVAGIVARRLTVAPDLLLAALMLGVIYLLAPSTVGTSWGFHDRFPPAIAAVLAAGLRLTRDNASGSPVPAHGLTFPRCLAAVVVIAVMARLVTVLVAWQGYDVRYAEYREAMRAIEPGSRLSAAIAVTGSADVLRRPSLYHLGNLATLERDAFFPTIFTYQAQQPLRLSRDFARQPRPRVLYRNTASDAMSDDPASPFSAEMLAHYDYVLVINESLFGPLPTTLEPVRSGNDFTLFRSPRTGQEDGS